MKNRVHNAWDDPRLPVEVKIIGKARVMAAVRLLRDDPSARVFIEEYVHDHPQLGAGVSFRNIGLFVGPLQVVCIQSKRST